MRILVLPEVREYLKELSLILYNKKYFSYSEDAEKYVEDLFIDIQATLHRRQKYYAPIIYRDLDLVEHLGSGVPRILKSYGKECFVFTDNFLRMVFPVSKLLGAQVSNQVTSQVADQVTNQVKEFIRIMDKEMDRKDIQDKLGLRNRGNFRLKYLKPALELGFIEMTIPEKPNS